MVIRATYGEMDFLKQNSHAAGGFVQLFKEYIIVVNLKEHSQSQEINISGQTPF